MDRSGGDDCGQQNGSSGKHTHGNHEPDHQQFSGDAVFDMHSPALAAITAAFRRSAPELCARLHATPQRIVCDDCHATRRAQRAQMQATLTPH